MKRLMFIGCVVAMGFTLTLHARAPRWVTQYVCDRNPDTGICLQVATIRTRADESEGRFHRPDTLRQLKAAVQAHDLMRNPLRRNFSGPRTEPGGGECTFGDPDCAGCYTPYWVTPTLMACDGACGLCTDSNSLSLRSLALQ